METYFNTKEQECIIILNEDGTTWSGLKSAYDEMQAEQSTPSVIDEAEAK